MNILLELEEKLNLPYNIYKFYNKMMIIGSKYFIYEDNMNLWHAYNL